MDVDEFRYDRLSEWRLLGEILDPMVKELAVDVVYETNLPGTATTENGDPQDTTEFGKVTLLSYDENLSYSTVGTGRIDFSTDNTVIAVHGSWWLRSACPPRFDDLLSGTVIRK